MKKYILGVVLLQTVLFGVSSCQEELPAGFEIDTAEIKMGADGGVRTVNVSAGETWFAKTQAPWITVSPANGVGPAECKVIVDSSLKFESREAVVRIETVGSEERHDFKVTQDGYEKMIALDKKEYRVESQGEYGKRTFEVKVKSNVPFEVELPSGAEKWLEYEVPELKLNRGARPRVVPVKFTWNINFEEQAREAVVKFNPLSEETLDIKDDLKILQSAADKIEIGIEGDSLAILAIANSLNVEYAFEVNEKMENWTNVKIWKDGPNKGRVRSVKFEMFSSKEPIPFQVKYLTACEELAFYSNTNAFLYNLSTGKHLSSLTQLKRLTIGAYGLTELDESLVNLKNLEYLSLEGNNFQKFPDILTPENFPNLHAIVIHANQRHNIYDLSNTVEKQYGGLVESVETDEAGNMFFPKRLLEWDNLDTLRLSVNYLQGQLPDMEHYGAERRWTKDEVEKSDTLSAKLIGMPKVLPNINYFAINLNKLSGKLPEWLLYHPKLDLWYPFALVFEQEGKDKNGKVAGFSNRPSNLDYYYAEYPNKKYNPNNHKDN